MTKTCPDLDTHIVLWADDETAEAWEPTVQLLRGAELLPVEDPELRRRLARFYQAACSVGKRPPGYYFTFEASQVFFRDEGFTEVEEVRLSGWTSDKGLSKRTHWTTDPPPRLRTGPKGALALETTDEGRRHFSGKLVSGDSGQAVLLLWDREGDAPQSIRYLLDTGRTLRDKRADLVAARAGKIRLPRKWSSVPQWDTVVQAEIDSLLEEHGERAFDAVMNIRGPLLQAKYGPDGEKLTSLTKDAENLLLERIGPKGFRRVFKDQDGIHREYIVKRFRAGSGYLETRLSWYGKASPLVDEALADADKELEKDLIIAEQGNLFRDMGGVREQLDSRLRFLGAVKDARPVMEHILRRFGSEGRNPVRVPAWEFRTLLECENDPNGFRRIKGALKALQELCFVIKGAGLGPGRSGEAFGSFLAEVDYDPRGTGRHTDGDFLLTLAPSAVGCLRVFESAHHRIKNPTRLLTTYQWGKKLTKPEKEELRDGYLRGFSTLSHFLDKAKGFTGEQSDLRRWIEDNITLRKDGASRKLWGKRHHATHAKSSEPSANEPRLYDRGFCPILPPSRRFHGALGHFINKPESSRTLYGRSSASAKSEASHSEGYLTVMGYDLPRGRSRKKREKAVRLALQDMKAVVEESFGGMVVANHGGRWLTLQAAADDLRTDELLKKARWFFFLPENWREHLATIIKEHHDARYARGETPYRVEITRDRTVYSKAQEERGYPNERPKATADPAEEPVVEPLRVRLQAARKKRDITQTQMGRLFGVSQKTVSYWELGILPDEAGKVRGKPIPKELAPLLERWIRTNQAPDPDGLAARTTKRTGKRKPKVTGS